MTRRLGVAHLWHFKKSPLEATYKPTGQKILFRGLDDPMSITSITEDRSAPGAMLIHGFIDIAKLPTAPTPEEITALKQIAFLK